MLFLHDIQVQLRVHGWTVIFLKRAGGGGLDNYQINSYTAACKKERKRPAKRDTEVKKMKSQRKNLEQLKVENKSSQKKFPTGLYGSKSTVANLGARLKLLQDDDVFRKTVTFSDKFTQLYF